MLRELAGAWREIAADAEVRCAIVTGAGERAFCCGMDMRATIPVSQALARGERVDPRTSRPAHGVDRAARRLRPRHAARRRGERARARGRLRPLARLRAARRRAHATFALEEVALGLYPTGNATVLLPRQIGWVAAHELLLTAQPIGAARALELGLLNRVVAPASLLATAFELADAIAANAPLAVRATRARRARAPRPAARRGLSAAGGDGRPLRRTEDAREAQAAFAEKREAEVLEGALGRAWPRATASAGTRAIARAVTTMRRHRVARRARRRAAARRPRARRRVGHRPCRALLGGARARNTRGGRLARRTAPRARSPRRAQGSRSRRARWTSSASRSPTGRSRRSAASTTCSAICFPRSPRGSRRAACWPARSRPCATWSGTRSRARASCSARASCASSAARSSRVFYSEGWFGGRALARILARVPVV